MKTSKIVPAIMLFVSAAMLSGCIFPYWDDGERGGGHRDGGYHDGEHHGEGRHGEEHRD